MNSSKKTILTYEPLARVSEISFSEISVARKCYIETYGCQMNFADSRIIMSVLKNSHYQLTENIHEADVVLINTCSIRDHAVQRVFKRLKEITPIKKKNPGLIIGIVGCIAEHAKAELFEQEPLIDLIAGPDSYRHLNHLLELVENGQKIIDTRLVKEETYDNLVPEYKQDEISAFVSIMRGCDNHCAYCVVPSTRGHERSRSHQSILEETEILSARGIKEITLLGQNVNSYLHKDENGSRINFAQLLENIASTFPKLRIRFATSHPKDIHEEILLTMSKYDHICKHLHLAMQSGSDRILKLMNRKYTAQSFIDKVKLARQINPGISITTDIIAGFSTETDEDHQMTLQIMEKLKFDLAYMFHYSARTGTYAAENLADDVQEGLKKQRLNEIIKLQQKHSLENNKKDIGKIFEVLVEGYSKRSSEMLRGRSSQNKMVIFPNLGQKPGDYVKVRIENCTSATLIGKIEN